MTKNQKITAVSLIAVGLIVLVPLFALRGAEFGGSDDAGSTVVEEVDSSYEPWATPIFEKLIGGELPGEVESLLFCLQTGIGVGVLAFGFGYLVGRSRERKRHERQEE